ncbi:rhomboid family intramembrane serine protease [Bacillus sp. FJAT-50079]|uniref:rhomboid family intramembrane serine protease n=1 Tax=Bacillus sp. FJAT-50079 TaxID=2833577 RepID=UPI001BC8DE56|nr:rhomboid family intramembrane serine protease [Bacillus sp. FJAT-50079]MBS4209599.1 rhomboid family intramembrane serine protease [Bacillus sp. FJAT-50079]
MAGQEDFLFWQLINEFISEKNYRLVRVNESQTEIWLENRKNKQARMIRLVRYDLDWNAKIRRDLQMVYMQAERLRKHFYARHLTVLNLYVSEHPPVDDDQLTRANIGNKKVRIPTVIITRKYANEALDEVGKIIGAPLDLRIKEEYEESEIISLKENIIRQTSDQVQEERQLFDFAKPFFAYFFMAVQIIMFLLMEAKGGSTNTETLITFGAKYNPLILAGEWWRFITPVFLHIGILHLLMNTLALYYLGTAVERMFGRIRFLWIYLFSGFAGTLASFVFTDHLSAGASGAIFGCFGALLYLGVVNSQLFFRTVGMNVIALIGINLIFGFSVPGIDNAGHIGGLIGGFFATGIVHFPKKRRISFQAVFALLTAAAIWLMFTIGFANDRPAVFNQMAQEYVEKGEWQKAYDLLSQYVNDGKGNELSYFQLSLLEIYQEDYLKARDLLEEAVEIEPKFHEAHFNLAILYLETGEIEQAKIHAEIANDLFQNDKYEQFIHELEKHSGEKNEISI